MRELNILMVHFRNYKVENSGDQDPTLSQELPTKIHHEKPQLLSTGW